MPRMSRATSHAAGRTTGASKLTATPTASERRTGTSGRAGPTACLQRGQDRLDARLGQEGRADHDRPGPQPAQPQRREHIQYPEGQPREHGQPQSGADLAVPDRGRCLPQPLRLGPVRARNDERHRHQARAQHRGSAEGLPGSRPGRDGAHHRAQQRPTTAAPPATPRSHRAVPPGRPGPARPGRPPRCTRRAALHETRGVQHDRSRRPAEDQCGRAHQHQAEQDHGPVAEPRVSTPPGREPTRVPRGRRRPAARRPPWTARPRWRSAAATASGP